MNAADAKEALKVHINPEKAAFFPHFFKTGKGEYGEGDQFIGVTVPNQRKVAKSFRAMPETELIKLVKDPVHEYRLTGLLILVLQYQRAKMEATKSGIVELYLSLLDHVNNWDLVDSSAHKILGDWLLDREDERVILDELAESGHLWRERVSVIACFPMIKNAEFDWILRLADWFLDHEHDLMHKAVGWMLREAGKVELDVLLDFLDENVNRMPRTMLRYAIEKLPERKRKQYLAL